MQPPPKRVSEDRELERTLSKGNFLLAFPGAILESAVTRNGIDFEVLVIIRQNNHWIVRHLNGRQELRVVDENPLMYQVTFSLPNKTSPDAGNTHEHISRCATSKSYFNESNLDEAIQRKMT
jgi:hypothetical protein